MDDPLLPEDKERLKNEMADEIIEKEGLRRDFKPGVKDQSESESSYKGQNGLYEEIQSESDSVHRAQNDPAIARSNWTGTRYVEEILPSFNDKKSSNAEENQRRNELSPNNSSINNNKEQIPNKEDEETSKREDIDSLADIIASKIAEEIVIHGMAKENEESGKMEDIDLVIDTYEIAKEDKESSRVETIYLSVDIIAHEIAEELRDMKSINFYRLIASRCPTSMIYEILAQVKEAQEIGAVRTTPARLFTAAIKNAAQEAGIDLESKVKFKRRREWGPKASKPWKLAWDLAEELDDVKGIAYYKKVARECPVKLLRWCLEEVKRQGRAVENKGALFNFLLDFCDSVISR